MIRLKNILVPTDFGDAAEVALNYGRDLARSYGASLHVVHVADNVMVRFAGEGSLAFLPGLQAEIEKAAAERVDTILSDEDRTQLHAVATVITSLAIADSLVDFAKDRRIDLIVMGTHGRGGMSHLLMGSVAERVVRMAPCPVLTVRHPERDFVVPDALVAMAKG